MQDPRTMFQHEAEQSNPALAPRQTRRGPPGMGGAPRPQSSAPRVQTGPMAGPVAPQQPRAPKKMNFVEKGLDTYRRAPIAAQAAHAIINPITGIPMAIAAHRGAIKKGLNKFGNGIRNFGRRAIGGIANAFKWRK